MNWYESTLKLQPEFGPAKDRLRTIQCYLLSKRDRRAPWKHNTHLHTYNLNMLLNLSYRWGTECLSICCLNFINMNHIITVYKVGFQLSNENGYFFSRSLRKFYDVVLWLMGCLFFIKHLDIPIKGYFCCGRDSACLTLNVPDCIWMLMFFCFCNNTNNTMNLLVPPYPYVPLSAIAARCIKGVLKCFSEYRLLKETL